MNAVALCTIYINNVHETAKNKSEIYIYIIHLLRMKSVVRRGGG